MIRSILAAAALAACTAAQADVVYNWQAISASPGLPQTSGQLTILESAWSSGGQLSYRAGASCAPNSDQPGCYGWAGSPVRSVSFSTGQDNPGAGFGRNLTAPGQGYSTIADLAFLTNGGLSGRIESGSVGEFLQMSGSDIWRVDVFGTDFSNSPCTVFGACSGATGRWVLDASTIPDGAAGQVPEPGILPLMALANVGLGLSLRRQRR